ncbi:MAG TPA: hypothetical protein VMX13_08485 [Sedimentisphaerales bacterium]|nr:hypothetical protein [Sedimentisphaerales bacterium]
MRKHKKVQSPKTAKTNVEQKPAGRRPTVTWASLAAILLLSLLLRLAGIWRTEPMDWHSDEYALAKSVVVLGNNGSIGLKPLYNWPSCSVIHALGYGLYALKRWLGPYTYENVLMAQRLMSTAASTAAVFMVFLFIKKLFSLRAGLFAAMFVGVAMLPVEQGHYGTITSIVVLIVVSVMLLSYDLFDVAQNQTAQLKAGRCCLVGLLCGWGIAGKWTILLSAIPISGAFFLSLWAYRKTGRLSEFIKINSKRAAIIIAMLVIAFLAGCPDIQFAPDKVIEGFNYEMRHHKTGHYGGFTIDDFTWHHRILRTGRMLEESGNIYFLIAGIAAIVFCLLKPTRPRVFLLWTMLIWLMVVYRNFVTGRRHHMIPFYVMLMLVAAALDVGTKSRIVRLRFFGWAAFVFLTIGGILYTCITISPLWRPDPMLECSKWIKANVPRDNGLSWMYPSPRLDKSLANIYPVNAPPGKDQYIVVKHGEMRTFTQHPPTRQIVPSEWFPKQPPSMEILVLYAQMNAGGGPDVTLVKDFYPKPSFLGLDSRLFFQTPGRLRIMASRGISLFRLNRTTEPQGTDAR